MSQTWQQQIAAVSSQITTAIVTNGSGLITAALLQTVLLAMLGLFYYVAPLSMVTQSVPNTTALAALDSTQVAAVMRMGVSGQGDAPPQLFLASGSVCSLNAGAGDTGSQVPSVNGKCFLAALSERMLDPRQFGLSQSNVDNSAAISAAAALLAQ
jgi:hypothetical protein